MGISTWGKEEAEAGLGRERSSRTMLIKQNFSCPWSLHGPSKLSRGGSKCLDLYILAMISHRFDLL